MNEKARKETQINCYKTLSDAENNEVLLTLSMQYSRVPYSKAYSGLTIEYWELCIYAVLYLTVLSMIELYLQ